MSVSCSKTYVQYLSSYYLVEIITGASVSLILSLKFNIHSYIYVYTYILILLIILATLIANSIKFFCFNYIFFIYYLLLAMLHSYLLFMRAISLTIHVHSNGLLFQNN